MSHGLIYTKPIICLLITGIFIFQTNVLSGQSEKNTETDKFTSEIKLQKNCPQKDLGDLFRKEGVTREPRKTMLLVMPNVSSNPLNGLLLGVAGSTGFYLGGRENSRVSAIGFNVAYTTKNQFLAFAKSNVYTKGDRFFLQGDWRYFIYNAPTWGLGTNAPDSVELENSFVWQGAKMDDISDGYKLSYNYLKLHEIMNYKVAGYTYVGLGYHLDYFYKIVDNSLRFDTIPYQLTPHYLYTEIFEFDSSKYAISGLSLNMVYDSRDNLINPYKGSFINLNYRNNLEFLGSSQNSSSLWVEYRTYIPLSKNVQRHLLAFWLFGNIRVTGRQPYLTLMATGEDQRARSGRGYIAGRFRGEDMVYGEVEYRFPISQCSKVLGGVLFLNATTTSNQTRDVSLFSYIRPGAGVGLRLMLNKNFRTNITLDFGFGHKSQGFYFSGTETF